VTEVLTEFFQDERAQDLIEYSLLLAFVVFTVAGIAKGFGASVAGIASVSTSQVNAASTTVS
jgi:Flp pilus assembly pilin Flp